MRLQRLVESARQHAKSAELPDHAADTAGPLKTIDDRELRGALGRVNALLGREPLAGLSEATHSVINATKSLVPSVGAHATLLETAEEYDDEGDDRDGFVAEADGARRRVARAGGTSESTPGHAGAAPAAVTPMPPKMTPRRTPGARGSSQRQAATGRDTDNDRLTRSVLKGQRKAETFEQQLLLTATSVADYIAQQRRMVEVAAVLEDPEAGIGAATPPGLMLADRARLAVADAMRDSEGEGADGAEEAGTAAAAAARGKELALVRERRSRLSSLASLAKAGSSMVDQFSKGDQPSAWLQRRESAVATRLRGLTASAKMMEEAHGSFASIIAAGGTEAEAQRTAISTYLASRQTSATLSSSRAIEQAVLFTAESVADEAARTREAMEEAAFKGLQTSFAGDMRKILDDAKPQCETRLVALCSGLLLVITLAMSVLLLSTGGMSVVTQLMTLLRIDPTCLEFDSAGDTKQWALTSALSWVPGAAVVGASWSLISCWALPAAIAVLLMALCIALPAVGSLVTSWLLAAALVYGLLADLKQRHQKGFLLPPVGVAAGTLSVLHLLWAMLEAARFSRLRQVAESVKNNSLDKLRHMQMDAASAVSDSDASSLSHAALLSMPLVALLVTIAAGLLVGDSLTCPDGTVCLGGLAGALSSITSISNFVLQPLGE